MSVDRALISRFALPQSSAEWGQLAARCLAVLAKVPIGRWQFFIRLLLVVCLSATLARFFWMLLPSPSIPPAALALPSSASHAVVAGSAVNIDQLKSLSVFGKEAPAQKQDAPQAVPENQTVETKLNLVLMGVVASSDDKLARAIISSGEKQDVYAIGDTLPVGNGVTLFKVTPDRVIINNNNQFENLWLYQPDPNRAISSPAQPSNGQMLNSGSEDESEASYPAVATPTPPPAPRIINKNNAPPPQERSVSSDPIMTQATRNLADVVAMSVYREGGQVVGYKIRPGRDVEKFRALGLQADDVVTAVNGMPLNNPAKIMEVYKNMGNATSASLEIKRGGNVMTVDVVLH